MSANRNKALTWAIIAIVGFGLWWAYSQKTGASEDLPTALPLPTPTHSCNPDSVRNSLDAINGALEAWDDAAVLVVDTWKAANYSAASSAVVTAFSGLTAAERVIDAIRVPDCINQVLYSLRAYVHSQTQGLRACVFDSECSAGENADESTWYDFQAFGRYAECLIRDPLPGSQCDYPQHTERYQSDGDVDYTPDEQATIDAIAAPYRTQAAMTEQQ